MLTVEDLARIVHNANRDLCQVLGDFSQPLWDFAPDWQKASAIEGIKSILDGTVKSPEDSHVSWLTFKQKDGWKYGPVKDPEKKEHPCMVPYDHLPTEQRLKDHLFFGIVRGLAVEVDRG